ADEPIRTAAPTRIPPEPDLVVVVEPVHRAPPSRDAAPVRLESGRNVRTLSATESGMHDAGRRPTHVTPMGNGKQGPGGQGPGVRAPETKSRKREGEKARFDEARAATCEWHAL